MESPIGDMLQSWDGLQTYRQRQQQHHQGYPNAMPVEEEEAEVSELEERDEEAAVLRLDAWLTKLHARSQADPGGFNVIDDVDAALLVVLPLPLDDAAADMLRDRLVATDDTAGALGSTLPPPRQH